MIEERAPVQTGSIGQTSRNTNTELLAIGRANTSEPPVILGSAFGPSLDPSKTGEPILRFKGGDYSFFSIDFAQAPDKIELSGNTKPDGSRRSRMKGNNFGFYSPDNTTYLSPDLAQHLQKYDFSRPFASGVKREVERAEWAEQWKSQQLKERPSAEFSGEAAASEQDGPQPSDFEEWRAFQ